MLRYAIIFAVVLVGALARPGMKHAGRIVNGTDAAVGQYPFMASLQYKDSAGSHFCGGSILNANYILTASHCVDYESYSDLAVVVGTVELNRGGSKHEVAGYTQHAGYSPSDNYIHDIAVIKLAEPIVFDDLVQPVPLPEQLEPTPGGTPATVIGFGYPYTGGDIMNHLQQVGITVYSDEECQSIHYDAPHDSNICAGVPEGGKGQCSGDSGGPLIANGHQVGLVSWSVKPCTVAPYPGVYTEVAYYIDWLKENTNL